MPYPASISGRLSDVYTSVALMPANIQVGQEQWDASTGKRARLCIANGNIAINASVAYDPAQANTYTMISNPSGRATVGVNDNGGVALVAGNVFWATIGGPCTPLVTAATAAGVSLTCNTTAGTLTTAAAADVIPIRVETRAASGGGGATACWMYG